MVRFENADAGNTHGYAHALEDSLRCALPLPREVRAGELGVAECKLSFSLNGGLHWSWPPLLMTVAAAPSIFDVRQTWLPYDMFCHRCVLIEFVGSHFAFDLGLHGSGKSRCWLGSLEGTVLDINQNRMTCAFYGDGPESLIGLTDMSRFVPPVCF